MQYEALELFSLSSDEGGGEGRGGAGFYLDFPSPGSFLARRGSASVK